MTPRYPPYLGGVETHVSELATRAKNRFSRVSVITTDPSGQLPPIEHRDGLTIYRVRAIAPRENYHLPILPQLLRRLRECPADVTHLHSIHDLPGPLAGALTNRGALVLTPHYTGWIYAATARVFFAAYRPFIRRLARKLRGMICVSEYESRLIKRAFPEAKGKITVIPNGIDPILPQQYSWREPEKPTILFVGRLESYKNADKTIQALSILRKNSPAKLVIVGRGPHKQALHRLASSLRLDDGVEWREGIPRTDLYRLYTTSSVVVLPSEGEAFGLAAAEAISVGAPTIVTNSSALAEFVEERLAIPVHPPVTAQNLAEVLSRVLENPSSFSPKGVSSGLIQTWDKVAETTFRLYEALA